MSNLPGLGVFKPKLCVVFMAMIAALPLSRVDGLAGGFMIPHQTARALGLANAVTAGVNDPSAVY